MDHEKCHDVRRPADREDHTIASARSVEKDSGRALEKHRAHRSGKAADADDRRHGLAGGGSAGRGVEVWGPPLVGGGPPAAPPPPADRAPPDGAERPPADEAA